ncbi:hypothetical protein JTY60_00350 [symbiont of Argiope bruennichi]|uniref:hypothetical protein n=1 Tax=symbiont of Argiope bruennichi TaxID=2810479 RepID=UPI003DA5FB30
MDNKEIKNILMNLTTNTKKGEKVNYLKENIKLIEELDLSENDIFAIIGLSKDWYEEKKDILKFSSNLDEILKHCNKK